ncbi:hypothetical protein NDN08_002652 [Rhodosorus marinus]|uniref:RecQ-mediated genome instability protein 1 n=1 Tax=Rhodosorus marinus TaxID=101924 RepID=A0AAV8UYL5_9RHOD|nr:hypothetical protein NDN08_002652 [Rhodosorus marinus]
MAGSLADVLSSRGVLPLKDDVLARMTTSERAWDFVLQSDLDSIVKRTGPDNGGHFATKLVQIMDVISIGTPDAREDVKASPARTLSLSVSDGRNIYTAIEYKSMPALAVSTLPGTKLLLKAPLVQRGLIFVTPDTAEVLPSYVPSLAERNASLRLQPSGTGRRLDLGGIASIPNEENEDDVDDNLLIETLQRIESNAGGQ